MVSSDEASGGRRADFGASSIVGVATVGAITAAVGTGSGVVERVATMGASEPKKSGLAEFSMKALAV